MPTYVARCSKCDTVQDFVRKVNDRDDTPICCDAPTARQLVAPQISAMTFTGHKGFHTTDGAWIESGQDLHRYMKKNDLLSGSEGESEAKHQRANIEREKDQKLRRC